MGIVKPQEMDFSNKNIIMIISGLPGTGKSTLANSAEKPLSIDTDEGTARVRPEHRIDTSVCKTYEEILADIKAAEGHYKTLVIDTCGALIEYMKEWAMRTDPKASKANGGFSLQGYGIIKSEFIRLSAELRKKFNVIYIFHEKMIKNGDDGTFYDLVVEGSAKEICWQPSDIGGHLFIDHGKRYIGFTPTEQYSAKSAYGIKGIIEVPELQDGEPNDFLTKLFNKIRANLAKEQETISPQKAIYDETMKEAKRLCSLVSGPEDIADCAKLLEGLDHALTSNKESKAMLKARMQELGIVWDKATKTYKYAEQK